MERSTTNGCIELMEKARSVTIFHPFCSRSQMAKNFPHITPERLSSFVYIDNIIASLKNNRYRSLSDFFKGCKPLWENIQCANSKLPPLLIAIASELQQYLEHRFPKIANSTEEKAMQRLRSLSKQLTLLSVQMPPEISQLSNQ